MHLCWYQKRLSQKTIPDDLNKLNNIMDNDFVKKTVYEKLVIKVNAFDSNIPSISGLVTKRQYHSDKQVLKKKIGDLDKKITKTSGLV